MPETFITVRQIAEALHVNPRTVWRWAARGVLPRPVVLSPGCTRWREADVIAALARLSDTTVPPAGRRATSAA